MKVGIRSGRALPCGMSSISIHIINETLSQGGAIPGYWTNLQMLRINAKVYFSDSTNLMLGYNYMLAPEKTNLTRTQR